MLHVLGTEYFANDEVPNPHQLYLCVLEKMTTLRACIY